MFIFIPGFYSYFSLFTLIFPYFSMPSSCYYKGSSIISFFSIFNQYFPTFVIFPMLTSSPYVLLPCYYTTITSFPLCTIFPWYVTPRLMYWRTVRGGVLRVF